MGDTSHASPATEYGGGVYKGIGLDAAEESETLSGQGATPGAKGPGVLSHIFSDVVEALFEGRGAFMWQIKTLPWKLYFKSLVQYRYSDEVTRASENIKRISVLAFPTFPKRGGDVELLKVAFLHVKKLTQDSIEEIMKAAVRSRTKMMSGRQSEVRDTCVVVIADEQERGANMALQAQARQRGANGSRIAYVFAAKRGAYIRKLLFQFLGHFFSKRSAAVEAKAEETLRRMGVSEPKVYGDLGTCCEFVSGLGRAMLELSAKIRLAWGSRKTKEERQRDQVAGALHERDHDSEMKVAREKMRELAGAEMARRDRFKQPAPGA